MSQRLHARKPVGAARGVSSALVSRLVVRLLGLGLVLLAARQFGVEEFVTYSYLLALGDTCLSIIDSGVGPVVSRSVAKGEINAVEALERSLVVQAASSSTAGLACLLIGLLSHASNATPVAVLVASIVVVLNGLFNLYADLVRAQGHAWVEASLRSPALCSCWFSAGSRCSPGPDSSDSSSSSSSSRGCCWVRPDISFRTV